MGNVTYVLGNPFVARLALETAWLASYAAEGLECLEVEVAVWVLRGEVGEVSVHKDVRCDVEDNMGPGTSEVASVGLNRLFDALAAPGDDDGEIVAVGSQRFGREVLEFCEVEGDWVATAGGEFKLSDDI